MDAERLAYIRQYTDELKYGRAKMALQDLLAALDAAEQRAETAEAVIRKIAGMEPGMRDGGIYGMTSEDCYRCNEMIELAAKWLEGHSEGGRNGTDDHLNLPGCCACAAVPGPGATWQARRGGAIPIAEARYHDLRLPAPAQA